MILAATPQVPDTLEFYIWLVGILFGIVSFFIGWYMFDTKTILKEVRESVNQLVTNDAVKQEQINTMDKRILTIESKIFTVNYGNKN